MAVREVTLTPPVPEQSVTVLEQDKPTAEVGILSTQAADTGGHAH